MSSMNGSPEAAALRAIRETHKHPKKLSASGEVSWRKWRSSASILRTPGTLFLKRRERFVWRTKGKAGADLRNHPLAFEIEKAEKAHRADLAKLDRSLRFQFNGQTKGVKTRQEKASAREKEVLALAEEHAHRGCGLASFIAGRVGVSPRRVRQIMNKKGK